MFHFVEPHCGACVLENALMEEPLEPTNPSKLNHIWAMHGCSTDGGRRQESLSGPLLSRNQVSLKNQGEPPFHKNVSSQEIKGAIYFNDGFKFSNNMNDTK